MGKYSRCYKIFAWVVLAALFVQIAGAQIVTATGKYEKITYSLNSDEVSDASIGLYVYDEILYITVEDLCALTRSEYSEKDGVITIQQGVHTVDLDTGTQTFSDGFQDVSLTILNVDHATYAVPALQFLSYFKATAFVYEDTLYCRMPSFTAWEALGVDYDDSLVDIYELYGGKNTVTFSMCLDIIVDFVMGNASTSDGYLNDAFVEALEVNLSEYDAVKQYTQVTQEQLYDDVHSENGLQFLETIAKFAAEPVDWFIQYYYNKQEKSFVEDAYKAYSAGNVSEVKKYGEKFYEAFTKKNQSRSNAEKIFTSADYVMLFVSSIVEITHQMKYIEATDNLAYHVMGQENLKYLGFEAGDNDWFRIANEFKNVVGVSAASLENTIKEYVTSDSLWEKSIGTIVSTATSISEGTWLFASEAARLLTERFPWTAPLVEAFQADLSGIYLSELQQNVYAVVHTIFQKLQDQPDDPELLEKLIQAEEFYCRVSIAMYENINTAVKEFSSDAEYWTPIFQEKIDRLAVSLYQLTDLQEDSVDECFPMDLSSFQEPGMQSAWGSDQRYQVFEMDLTWEEAEAFCEQMGGHLATITSPEEQTEIFNLIKNGQSAAYWLGGTMSNGEWSWITGESFDYTLWDSGEPNECEENMHVQVYGDNGTWDDTWNEGNVDDGMENHGFIYECDTVNDTNQTRNMVYKYLDEAPIIGKEQYTGNEGDSFVYKIGKHRYTRGETDLDGNSYEHGLEGWVARWNYTEEKSWTYSAFNIGGDYSQLTGQCVLMKSYNTTDFDTTLEISGDGRILGSYHLTPDAIPFDISLDITGVEELKVYFYDNKAAFGGTSFGLTGMELQ